MNENPMCYYAIENKYKNTVNTDEYSTVLRDLTNSKITEDGKILFADNNYLDNKYISNISDERIKSLLSQLI